MKHWLTLRPQIYQYPNFVISQTAIITYIGVAEAGYVAEAEVWGPYSSQKLAIVELCMIMPV